MFGLVLLCTSDKQLYTCNSIAFQNVSIGYPVPPGHVADPVKAALVELLQYFDIHNRIGGYSTLQFYTAGLLCSAVCHGRTRGNIVGDHMQSEQ